MPISIVTDTIQYVVETLDKTAAEPTKTKTTTDMPADVKFNKVWLGGDIPSQQNTISVVLELTSDPNPLNDYIRYKGNDYRILNFTRSALIGSHYNLQCQLMRSNN